MIRIVGLSATLPNYHDVARFLRVNPNLGLFFFDARFRPVPLGQTFIGIKARSVMGQLQDMDVVCFEKVLENVEDGHQVCFYVHCPLHFVSLVIRSHPCLSLTIHYLTCLGHGVCSCTQCNREDGDDIA